MTLDGDEFHSELGIPLERIEMNTEKKSPSLH